MKIPGIEHPLPLFDEYLKSGYYPFGQDPEFEIELSQVINRTLEVDIPQFVNLTASTGRKPKRLLAIIATFVPFKPNLVKLASQVQVSRNNLEDYLLYVEKAGLIAQLRDHVGSLGSLGKVDKIYLDNTNLIFNLGEGYEESGTIRETFFLNQMRVNNKIMSSPISDFEIDEKTFEIGEKSKTGKQLEDTDEGYIAKADIEYGHNSVIPL